MTFKAIMAAIVMAGICAVQPAKAALNPSAQDFFETAYGYRSKKNAPAAAAKRPALRDAVSSPVKGGAERVFVRILPKTSDYRPLLALLSDAGDFVFGGEITIHADGASRVYIFGWARPGSLASIKENPGVAGVFEEAR
ncbi:MAG: hypothetical protein RDU13_03690 [Elusimicrobiales bacterium]|jgi:hypothetical protein|nr:hypothetical protein [Elusimicrobiales bacterium]